LPPGEYRLRAQEAVLRYEPAEAAYSLGDASAEAIERPCATLNQRHALFFAAQQDRARKQRRDRAMELINELRQLWPKIVAEQQTRKADADEFFSRRERGAAKAIYAVLNSDAAETALPPVERSRRQLEHRDAVCYCGLRLCVTSPGFRMPELLTSKRCRRRLAATNRASKSNSELVRALFYLRRGKFPTNTESHENCCVYKVAPRLSRGPPRWDASLLHLQVTAQLNQNFARVPPGAAIARKCSNGWSSTATGRRG
jgi:hypothetical protein